jgi:RNA polymerase-binding protein DksA
VAKTPHKKPAPAAKSAKSTKTAVKVRRDAKAPRPEKKASKRASARPAPRPAAAAVAKAGSRDLRHANGKSRAPEPRAIPSARPVPHNGNPIAIQEAVPTDGKPRKNLAGLTMRELEHYRDLLLAKRRELVGDMSAMEREALRSSGGSNLSTLPIHMADMGTDNYEQEFTLGLVEKDRNLLRAINAALAKIQNGTYGICEGTGKPIGKPRLEAQPWARFGIDHARQLERNGRPLL